MHGDMLIRTLVQSDVDCAIDVAQTMLTRTNTVRTMLIPLEAIIFPQKFVPKKCLEVMELGSNCSCYGVSYLY